MRGSMKIVFLTNLLYCIIGFSCGNVQAGLLSWGDETLVTVGEEKSSSEDFKTWWKLWQEKDQPLPQSAEPYIDWLLFAQDAERMMLFDDPSYQRDMRIYLKVLSLEQLRHDEVTSKISIAEDEVEKKYNELYVPAWLYTSIIVKDKATAEHLYDDLQSGKMDVTDLVQVAAWNEQVLQGHSAPEKTGDDLADVVKKYPGLADTLLGVQQNSQKRPFNSDKVLVEVFSGLAKGAFSKPFAWQDNYVIVQMLDIYPGDKDDFERQSSTETAG